MSPEKAKELMHIYTNLFSENRLYFECHDGWFDLLKKLISQIKEVCESDGFETPVMFGEPINVEVTQIKEKYGTLRFYTNCYNAFIQKLIDEACQSSETICECCGNQGTLGRRNLSWSVRCKDCETA